MNERSFTVHEIPGYIASLFVVESEAGLLLLDGGSRGDLCRLDAWLKSRGYRPDDVKLCVVTHMHPDHAAMAQRLRKRDGVPIAAHRDVDRWYRGFWGWLQHKVDCLLAQYSANRNRQPFEFVWYGRKVKPDHLLMDGDSLPGFPDWQVLWVPGHTLYDIVLFHAGDRTLYAADLAIFRHGRYLLPFPVPFPERMRESLNRLSELPVDTLLLAHGGTRTMPKDGSPFGELADRVGRAGQERFKKLAPLCELAPDIRRRKSD